MRDFLNTYYEPSAQYHELSAQEETQHPQPRHGSKPSLDEDMPNFDASPTPRIDWRRGMSIDQHLPTPVPDVAEHPLPGRTDFAAQAGPRRDQPSSFAAQAHRSRSQPDLRGENPANRQGSEASNNAGVFEMAGDVPTVPPVSLHQDAMHPRLYGSSEYPIAQIPYDGTPVRSRPLPSRPAPIEHTYAQHAMRNRGPPHANPGYAYHDNQLPLPAASEPPRPSSDFNRSQSQPRAPHPVNPDALPAHPTPVRYGLSGTPNPDQPSKPPPMRQYNHSAPPTVQPTNPPPSKSESEQVPTAPVTHGELERLQQAVKAKPSDPKTQLLLAKKLAEAAIVLADNGGRADAKTRTKNRERYVQDALKITKKLVSNGNPDATFYLADCYGTGRLGLEVDPKEAFNLYQSAAKVGHAQSAYRAAVCCEMGQEGGGGTKKDPLRAIHWYKKAASLGDSPAMYKMGMILLKGLLGQTRNAGEAIIWLKRAAERADEENPHALHELVRPVGSLRKSCCMSR